VIHEKISASVATRCWPRLAVAEKARDESRELTAAEAEQVNAALSEAQACNEKLAADERHKHVMSQLDAMAASASPDVLGGSGRHVALTGVHAKHMAEKIIVGMPRDSVSSKALVTGGTQTTSTILLPEVVATGRPAVSVLDLLPARIVPPGVQLPTAELEIPCRGTGPGWVGQTGVRCRCGRN
jgi:hypothetical protein